MEFDGVPLSLPPFVKGLHPHQDDAVRQIIDQFKTRRVVILDAPTGAGKTLIGEVARQLMRTEANGHHEQCLYVCTTKSLQEQFTHDFKHARAIKGRANYPTYDRPDTFDQLGARHLDASYCTKQRVTAGDLPKCDQCEYANADMDMDPQGQHDDEIEYNHCNHCHPWQSCPYEVAKNEAVKARLAVANTAYFLTEANHVGRFGARSDGKGGYYPPRFPFVVVDEADTLESVLMGFVEVSFSARAMKEYGLNPPEKKTVAQSWLDWCVSSLDTLREQRKTMFVPPDGPIEKRRALERINSHIDGLGEVERSLRLDPDNWAYDPSRDGVTLKPVRVAPYTAEKLWRHGKKWLLMSATTISPHQMADDLGLGPDEWGFVEVDSNFPPERRPIIIAPRANMTNKTKDIEWPKMVKAVEDKLQLHQNERVLVHTVSYAWTKYLYDALRRTDQAERLLTYEDGRQRESILESYKQRPNAVLLAPSLDRGIDLPDDLCRAIIITKVPYPNLGDAQVNKRFYGTGQSGKSWYATETIRSIVQMTGRGMRHKNDQVTSYILDSQFTSNLFQNPLSRNRLPKWWAAALKWDAPRRQT